MIDRTYAQNQTVRLAGTVGFADLAHEYPEAISELIDVLVRCESEPHAKAAVDGILRDCHRCPTPSEMRVAVEGARTRKPLAPQKLPDCELCGDTGWLVEDRGSNSYAKPCKHQG